MKRLQVFYYVWHLMIFITTAAAGVVIPLFLAFNLQVDLKFYLFDIFVMIIFIIDVLLSSQKLFKANLEEESQKLSRFLLFLDILAALPFSIFFGLSLLSLNRMLKLPKLLLELKKIRYQEIKFDTGIMIFNLLFIISLLAHWLACIWTFLSGLNASISLGSNYINSIYLIITTLTTVGYGDIVPQNDIQKIFTMIVQLLGIGIYGFVIGNITLQLNKRDPAKQIHQINIEKLKALIKYHNIPQEFRFRVKNYYDYMWNNKIGQDAAGLLDGLPLQLKSEISTYLKNEVIAKIQLFKGMDKVFLKQLASKLEPVILIPGDKIFETGDPGDAMFFIIRGNLIILNKDANLINTLSTGDFFGEISLFENRKRSATVIAKSFCELYKLSKDDFEKVINIDSEIYHKIRSKADSRIKKYT